MIKQEHRRTPLPQSDLGFLLLVSCSYEVGEAGNGSNRIS
jgi:hypothetical protein